MVNYDIIGNTYGNSAELIELLTRLGYIETVNGYSHPSKKAIFTGNYIDKGQDIPSVLSIVKTMNYAGNAIALMGVNEYNAICFNTKSDVPPKN